MFLGRAIDSTILCPVSAIAAQSPQPTEETMLHTQQLLDYLASQEEAVLTYNASNMILAVHSDASYLSEPKAQSCTGGHFFLSSDTTIPANNRALLNIAHIIKHVMSSATKAKLAALYIMAREAVYIHIVLEEMGHTQPPHHCRQIIQWPKELSMERCNQNKQRRRICASTGCGIGNVRSNSVYIGDLVS